MAKEVQQPTVDIQQAIDQMLEAKPETVLVCGKKRRIGWLHNGTYRKFSHIMLSEKDEWKRNTKLCACILLNHKNGLLTWLIMKLWYAIYWRWLYYVKDIDQVEIMGVLNASKKKIQLEPFLMNTTLAIGMMDTMMTMAPHEHGPAAPVSAQPTL